MENKAITMTLDSLELAIFGDTGIPDNQAEVLKLIKKAFEEKTPFF